MKMIRIEDEQYNKLSSMALEEGRSITNMMYQILDAALEVPNNEVKKIENKILEKPIVGPIVAFTSGSVYPTIRTFRDVLSDITRVEKQLKEDLEFCQDQETRDKLTRETNVQGLWDEYNTLKGGGQ